jgi:2-oxoglutarate/2-oxoacid ferredoxin oxidoreductase subunit beta
MNEMKNDQRSLSNLDRSKPDWCPGCGNYTILLALKRAVDELGLDSANTVVVTGIGCGSKINHFIRTYGFEGLHGRALPVATGVKLANHKLNVIVISGDGDAYGIGGNHFLHTCRRNINLTYITQDNSIYALTKGQTSPTSPQGKKTNSTPFGVLEEPINPLALAITAGASFVARASSFKLDQMTGLIKQAIQHKGFSLVNVMQYCPSMNRENNPNWFNENTCEIGDHNKENKQEALVLTERKDKYPLGLFYQVQKPTYDEQEPQIKDVPLVDQKLETDVSDLLEEFN